MGKLKFYVQSVRVFLNKVGYFCAQLSQSMLYTKKRNNSILLNYYYEKEHR